MQLWKAVWVPIVLGLLAGRASVDDFIESTTAHLIVVGIFLVVLSIGLWMTPGGARGGFWPGFGYGAIASGTIHLTQWAYYPRFLAANPEVKGVVELAEGWTYRSLHLATTPMVTLLSGLLLGVGTWVFVKVHTRLHG